MIFGAAPFASTPFAAALRTGASAGGTTIAPAKGHLQFTGYVPTIIRAGSTTISPANGHLQFTGHIPLIGRSQTISPPKGHLQFTGYNPNIIRSSPGGAGLYVNNFKFVHALGF